MFNHLHVFHTNITEEGIEYKFAQLTKWTNWARECLMQKRLITIFASDDKNSVADLDIAILQAILKGESIIQKKQYVVITLMLVVHYVLLLHVCTLILQSSC